MKIFLCSHLVRVRSSSGETTANLERIATGLATINTEEPMAVGTAVTIATEECEFVGTVARCTIEISGHEIDVALESHWSEEVFLPDHLFDPDVMTAPRRLR